MRKAATVGREFRVSVRIAAGVERGGSEIAYGRPDLVYSRIELQKSKGVYR
jgi:hypothetical protein